MGANSPLGAVARDIIDDSRYMVLATADESGRPWASPVYFAADGYREFFWVSSPEATHSRNIAVRGQVSIVVFDSGAAIGTGQAVYMAARAELVADDDLVRGTEVFSRRSVAHGARPWATDDVRPPAALRLYVATVSEHWVLAKDGSPDHRVPVDVTAP
ncbi:MAG: pyridoxamine 5'-phosphate oxidase family protein [Actinomycetes bacterium]